MNASWYKEDPCDEPVGCKIDNAWVVWSALPLTSATLTEAWRVPYSGGFQVAWTGFLGSMGTGSPAWYYLGETWLPPTSVGARILGQQVDDRFGFAVGTDGRWLYISAPDHMAMQTDVPSLPTGNRVGSGVVYQLRTDVRTSPTAPNLAQLWIEPGVRETDPNGVDPNTPDYETIAYPYLDAELPDREDYTMPVPHQYIIESVGSWRGYYTYENRPFT